MAGKTKLAMIHTGAGFVPAFNELARELLPERPVFHLVDESLLQNTVQSGRLEKATVRRLLDMVESAAQAGAGAVLVTCSTIGPAVPLLRPLFDLPVLRIDEAMAREAVRLGEKIGVLATLASTLEPTTSLLHDMAAQAGRRCELTPHVCAGAFECLLRGDTEAHDRLVMDGVRSLASRVEVLVLAQASMARLLPQITAAGVAIPVLTSPRLAVREAAEVLNQIPAGQG